VGSLKKKLVVVFQAQAVPVGLQAISIGIFK